MTAGARMTPLLVSRPPVPLRKRVFGLGSVFGKTLRDSRSSLAAVALTLGVLVMAGGATMANTYGTLEARRELALLAASLPPIMTGVYGNPVNVDTLGGFVTWHYASYLALLAGLWSILALSSTLAGEARRGSLEVVATTPLPRTRVALEKVAAHVVALSLAMAVVGATAWVTGEFFGRFAGDTVDPGAAAAFAIGLGARALVAGSVAFVVASFLGRGAGAGIAGALMVAGYVVNGYRSVMPAFDALADASWFAWTAGHLPLAGSWDWGGVAATLLCAVVLLAVGVLTFARSDIGVSGSIRIRPLPSALLGTGGPIRRSFGELLPTALAWGIGLGLYALVMAAASRSFVDELAKAPSLAEMVRGLVPGIDMTTIAGMLQLMFVDMGLVLVGLAAATLVAERLGDEPAGRLELQLATPLTRAGWLIASGIGVWAGIAVLTGCLTVAVGTGMTAADADAALPMVGTLALALYAAAMAGIGLAVAGTIRSSLAGPAVAIVSLGMFLIDILGPTLHLPGAIQQLALSNHMGEPMVGTWDPAGIAVCVGLAIGGLLLGAWGMRRRDVSG